MSGGSRGTGSGGSSSGKVDYPEYIKNIHGQLMYGGDFDDVTDTPDDPQTDSVLGDIYTVRDTAPYEGVSAYDPTDDLENNDKALACFKAAVKDISPNCNWQEFFSAASSTDIDKCLALQKLFDLAECATNIDCRLDWKKLGPLLRDAEELQLIDWPTILETVRTSPLPTDTEIDWEAITDMVVKKANSLVLSEAYIDGVVEAQDEGLQGTLNRQIAASMIQAADIGSELSSTFHLGAALLRGQHVKEVSKFRAELSLQAHRDRLEYIRGSVAEIMSSMTSIIVAKLSYLSQAMNLMASLSVDKAKLSMQREMDIFDRRFELEKAKLEFLARMVAQLAQIKQFAFQWKQQVANELSSYLFQRSALLQGVANLTMEGNRLRFLAQNEYIEKDVDYNVREALWEIELWQYGFHGLAAISGATTVSSGSKDKGTGSNIAGALGGALSGAVGMASLGGTMSGAAAGAVGGPPGMAVGALFGAAAGFLS